MTCTRCSSGTCELTSKIDDALELVPYDVMRTDGEGRRRTVLNPWWPVTEKLYDIKRLLKDGDCDEAVKAIRRIANKINGGRYGIELPEKFETMMLEIKESL